MIYLIDSLLCCEARVQIERGILDGAEQEMVVGRALVAQHAGMLKRHSVREIEAEPILALVKARIPELLHLLPHHAVLEPFASPSQDLTLRAVEKLCLDKPARDSRHRGNT